MQKDQTLQKTKPLVLSVEELLQSHPSVQPKFDNDAFDEIFHTSTRA